MSTFDNTLDCRLYSFLRGSGLVYCRRGLYPVTCISGIMKSFGNVFKSLTRNEYQEIKCFDLPSTY